MSFVFLVTVSGTYKGARGSYRKWDEVNMMNAMLAIERGNSLRQAAEMYQVPKSTLFDHVSGKVAFGARSGPDPYLTMEEEEELVNFLLEVADVGYPHTKKQVFSIVQEVLSTKRINSSVGGNVFVSATLL